MGDFLYNLVSRTLDLFYWGGDLIGEENLPARGPAVIVSNHLGPAGPIGVICSLPLRMYPWIISKMIDPEEAVDYICKDFVEKTLKMKPPLSQKFARQLCKITVPLLTEIGCLPVYRKSEKLKITWQKSLALLKEEKYIFITPEYDKGKPDPETKMCSFMIGFAQLGAIYHQATKKVLHFYPVAVHESRRVMVGKPIGYDPLNPGDKEMKRVAGMLEESIKKMYLQMANQYVTEAMPAWHNR